MGPAACVGQGSATGVISTCPHFVKQQFLTRAHSAVGGTSEISEMHLGVPYAMDWRKGPHVILVHFS